MKNLYLVVILLSLGITSETLAQITPDIIDVKLYDYNDDTPQGMEKRTGGYVAPLYVTGEITLFDNNGVIVATSQALNSLYTTSQYAFADLVVKKALNGGYIAGGQFTGDIDTILNHDTTGATPDAFLIKYNDTLGVEWMKMYGGSDYDNFNDIVPTGDGGYIAAGSATSNDGDLTGLNSYAPNHKWYIVKTDSNGIVEWQKTYGGPPRTPKPFDASVYASNIIQTSDSNYLVMGSMASDGGDVVGAHGANDIWVLKLDATGNIIWQKSLGGSANELTISGGSIGELLDGNYLIHTTTLSVDGDVIYPLGMQDSWVVKLDATTGNILWEKSLGGIKNDMAGVTGKDGNTFCELPNGSIIIGTTTKSTELTDFRPAGGSTDSNILISKLSPIDGSIHWQKLIGSTTYTGSAYNSGTAFRSLFPNPDGSLSIYGSNPGGAGGADYSTESYRESATSRNVWFKLEACPEFTYEPDIILCEGESYNFYGINITQAGSYNHTITGGATNGCDQVVMLNVEIDLLEQPVIIENNGTLSTEEAYAAYQWLKDGQPIDGANQATYTPTESGDYQVEVTNENGCSKISDGFLGINKPLLFSDIKLYPNPVNDVVHIEIPQLNDKASLSLISITGKVISTQTVSGSHTQIPVNGLAKGVYFVKISTNNATVVRKVIKK